MLARRLRPLSPARVLIIAAICVLPAATGVATAAAEIPWVACPTAPVGTSGPTTGYQCATVTQPLDRSGVTPGTIPLAVTRVPAASNPNATAVVALAGGPGQAALPLAQTFAKVMQPAIATRDLLVFDQRGTGSSGVLKCDALSGHGSIVSLAQGCATEIGAGRGFYRTADTVADIEALRVAGGYSKLVLFGVSYGTKVAEDYAAAYPQNVEALVLDSVVLPEGPDPFQRSTLTNVPRVLKNLCAGDACRGATDSVTGDLTKLAAQLRTRQLRGRVILSSGLRVRLAAGQSDLVAILLAGDLNPTLRAELPGSMRAALRGDAAPLLRLAVRSEGLTTGLQLRHGRLAAMADPAAVAHQSDAPSAESNALFLATTCEEAPFAWTRTAGVEQRYDEIEAAAKAIPKAQLGPFSPAAAVQGGPVPMCLGWPDASPPPAASGPLPAVRTLVLDGQMDLRTPYEDAAQIASRIPGASIVQVPYTGHSTVSSDTSTDKSCTKGALAAFFAGGTAGACTPSSNPYLPTKRPPTSLRAIKASSTRARTLIAAAATVTDAARQIIGDALALDALPRHVGGLRAGNATVTSRAGAFKLNSYQYVPGVSVSGTVNSKRTAKITIHGGGALRGTLRIGATGSVSGRLNGKKVTIGASAALRRGGWPSIAQALSASQPLG
jgi:pimeloyl-ACP methyl ester carboxylesterase